MAETASPLPETVSPFAHAKRALGWNLARVVPSKKESAALAATGVLDPVAQRYAVWRRSLLLLAFVPALAVFVLSVIDDLEDGYGDFTTFGAALQVAWLAAAGALPLACAWGVRSWRRPGPASKVLLVAWAVAFLVPFALALLPADLLWRVHEVAVSVPAELTDAAARIEAARVEKLMELKDVALDFVLGGSAYLLLLPAVLALLPGAMNGCLRIKSLLPAGQLPGWLLVCAAPVFLLLWLVILTLVNHAAQSPLLVLGVMLWAGSPVVYALAGRVFVRPQIEPQDAAKIGRVKRVAGIVALTGLGLMLAFVATKKVLGLSVLGTDPETAMTRKLDELMDRDDDVGIEDVQEAYADSTSLAYAFDLSSWQMVLDVLAKMLLGTAVFADLVLRATLAAWRNERSLRSRAGAYDESAAALDTVLSGSTAPATA